MPRVSVIIPTYNNGADLLVAVSSVLEQTYRDFEIVVVDDGSTDQTAQRLEPLRGRIRYIYQENQERCAARNRGIEESSGDLLAFLDADDFWVASFLEKLVALLDARPEIGLAHCWAWVVDGRGRRFRVEGRAPIPLADATTTFHTMLISGWICSPSTVLLRRACLEEVGCFDLEVPVYEDRDLWLRIARRYRLAELREPLAHYRCNGSSQAAHKLRRGIEAAHPRILSKFFSADTAPSPDREVRRRAYFGAYWDMAWTNYAGGDVGRGRQWLRKAEETDPSVFAPPFQRLIRDLAYRADAVHELSTTLDQTKRVLEGFFDHLPEGLVHLNALRRKTIGYAYGINLFRSRKLERWEDVRTAAPRALWYRPMWLVNRGFLSIWASSLLAILRPGSELKG